MSIILIAATYNHGYNLHHFDNQYTIVKFFIVHIRIVLKEETTGHVTSHVITFVGVEVGSPAEGNHSNLYTRKKSIGSNDAVWKF